MRPALVALSLLTSLAVVSGRQDTEPIKYDVSHLEKTWGIKFKSMAVNAREGEFKLTLEFTKDVSDLKEMRQALTSPSPKFPRTDIHLWFYYFDEDNVVLYKSCANGLEGELTGKKGDAFRLKAQSISDVFPRIRKVELRPREQELK